MLYFKNEWQKNTIFNLFIHYAKLLWKKSLVKNICFFQKRSFQDCEFQLQTIKEEMHLKADNTSEGINGIWYAAKGNNQV